jgi:transposase
VTDEDRQVIERMRARAEQCRRLAKAILDRSAAAVLLQMAEEVEADIARLESGEETGPTQHVPPPSQC